MAGLARLFLDPSSLPQPGGFSGGTAWIEARLAERGLAAALVGLQDDQLATAWCGLLVLADGTCLVLAETADPEIIAFREEGRPVTERPLRPWMLPGDLDLADRAPSCLARLASEIVPASGLQLIEGMPGLLDSCLPALADGFANPPVDLVLRLLPTSDFAWPSDAAAGRSNAVLGDVGRMLATSPHEVFLFSALPEHPIVDRFASRDLVAGSATLPRYGAPEDSGLAAMVGWTAEQLFAIEGPPGGWGLDYVSGDTLRAGSYAIHPATHALSIDPASGHDRIAARRRLSAWLSTHGLTRQWEVMLGNEAA